MNTIIQIRGKDSKNFAYMQIKNKKSPKLSDFLFVKR